eukprot:11049976-Lingulodinium_polyedra.AAC.1
MAGATAARPSQNAKPMAWTCRVRLSPSRPFVPRSAGLSTPGHFDTVRSPRRTRCWTQRSP